MTIIKTDRLILRRFHCNDWMDLYEYLSKEQVVKYEPYGVLTDFDCKKEAAIRSRNEAFIAVCLRDSNKLIGNIYFAQQEPRSGRDKKMRSVVSGIYRHT